MGSGEVFIIAKPKPLDIQGLVDQMNALMPKRPITQPPAIGMPPMFGPGDYLDYHLPRKGQSDA